LTKYDLARMVPFCICSKELEIERENHDLVMDGPFAEPDEYFRAPATTNKHCQMWHQT